METSFNFLSRKNTFLGPEQDLWELGRKSSPRPAAEKKVLAISSFSPPALHGTNVSCSSITK